MLTISGQMKIAIRELEVTDELDLFIQLLKDLYLELGEEAESVAYIDNDFCENLIHEKRILVLVAHHEETVVGFLTLSVGHSFYAGGPYGLLDEMYVVPAYRSMNAGKMLLAAAIEKGKEQGWKRIDVTAPTEERWDRTQSFYTANGFRFTGKKYKYSIG